MTGTRTPADAGARVDRPSPRRSPQAILALAVCGLTALTGVLSLIGTMSLPAAVIDQLNSTVAAGLTMVGMTGLALAGAVLAQQRPRSVIAWLMLATAAAWVVPHALLIGSWMLLETGSAAAVVLGWPTNWAWVTAYALSLITLMRFPTGRLPGPRWRIAEGAVLVWAAATILVTAFAPGPLGAEVLAPLTNPVGLAAVDDATADAVLSTLFMFLPVFVVVAALAPVVRWRRAGTRERSALSWVAVAAIVLAVAAPLAIVSTAGEILQGLAFLLLPIAIGTAVLRDQLWDLDLRRRYDRLRLARAQERERLRHELHDSLGPVLGSISMRAEAARNLLNRGETTRVDELLASISTTTEGALGEVRRLIDDLDPAIVGARDLVPDLRTQFAAYEEDLPVELSVTPDPLPHLEERAAATAYLLIGEAVRNAVRHSGGTRVDVRIRIRQDRLIAEIRDDGRGLGGAVPGVGRHGMARRIEEEGGRLRIEDADGGGTVVAFELPGARR